MKQLPWTAHTAVDLEQYSDNTYILYHQYDKLKLPVRADHEQRRTERKDGSIPELYV